MLPSGVISYVIMDSNVVNHSQQDSSKVDHHGPLTRYVKLRVTHAPGMPGTFSPPPLVGDPDLHHGTCVTHVPWCMPGSLTSGFLWILWRGKRSRHSWRIRNGQFYVSGKRSIGEGLLTDLIVSHSKYIFRTVLNIGNCFYICQTNLHDYVRITID